MAADHPDHNGTDLYVVNVVLADPLSPAIRAELVAATAVTAFQVLDGAVILNIRATSTDDACGQALELLGPNATIDDYGLADQRSDLTVDATSEPELLVAGLTATVGELLGWLGRFDPATDVTVATPSGGDWFNLVGASDPTRTGESSVILYTRDDYDTRQHGAQAWMRRYEAAIADAEQRYAPLTAAIKAATGLDSRVWQAGGMTMTLITHVDGPQGKGREYMTLVEQFNPDGTLEGTSSLFDHPTARAAGDDSDDEGARVLFAYAEPNPAQTSSAEWPRAFARPVTADEWAAAIRDHLATVPSAND